MSNNDTDRPLNERKWFNLTMLACAALAMLFAATGPISEKWFSRWPDVLQLFTAFLSRYGIYIAIGFLAVLMYVRRQVVWRWLLIAGEKVRSAYGWALGFALAPVLESRRAPVVHGRRCLLRHFTTGKYLTSLSGQNYTHNGSSTQQMVFGTSIPDQNSVWAIQPELGRSLREHASRPIQDGEIIRLIHEVTRCYLHSDINPSPKSVRLPPNAPAGDKQNEVSASTQHNPEDNWRVAAGARFTTGTKVRFTHTSSNYHLHSHDIPLAVAGRSNCTEVTCCNLRNDDDLWIVIDLDRTRVLVA